MSTDAVEAFAFFFGLAITAWAAAYAWGKWLTHRHDGEKAPIMQPSPDAERLARLESTVETLAVEMERIGESQRYMVKLLDERLPRSLAAGDAPRTPESGRLTTPQ